jgi:hypothetical protein
MRSGILIAVFALAVCTVTIDAVAQQPEAVMTIAGIPGQMIIRVDQTDWSQIQGMPDPRAPQLSTVGSPLTSRAGSPLTSRGGASGAGSGRAESQDVSVEKYIDKASPKMALACASGEVIPKVTIEIIPVGQDQRSRFVITMSGVVISQIVEQPATGRDRPFETVTFTCESLIWESQPAAATWRVSTPPYTVTPRPH